MPGVRRLLVIEYSTLDELEAKLKEELEKVWQQKTDHKGRFIIDELMRDISENPCEYLYTYRWPVHEGRLLVPVEWLAEQAGSTVAIVNALKGRYRVVELYDKQWVVAKRPLLIRCVKEYEIFSRACRAAKELGVWVVHKGNPCIMVPSKKLSETLGITPNKLTRILRKWGIKKKQIRLDSQKLYAYIFYPSDLV